MRKKLKNILGSIISTNPNYMKIYIRYYGDVYDEYTGECLCPQECIGESVYHNGELDTTNDPNNFSLDEEVEIYELIQKPGECGVYNLNIDLGRLN